MTDVPVFSVPICRIHFMRASFTNETGYGCGTLLLFDHAMCNRRWGVGCTDPDGVADETIWCACLVFVSCGPSVRQQQPCPLVRAGALPRGETSEEACPRAWSLVGYLWVGQFVLACLHEAPDLWRDVVDLLAQDFGVPDHT